MKQYRIYVIIIAVLAIIYGFLMLSPTFKKGERPKIIHLGLVRESVTRMVIENPLNEQMDLVLDDNEWSVIIDGVPQRADQGKVNGLLNSMVDLISVRVASRDLTDLKPFGLDDESVHRVYIYANDKIYSTVMIGKTAMDFKSNFFKLLKGDAVLLSPDTLVTRIRGTSRNWLDLVMISVDTRNIVAVDLFDLSLIKERGTWYFRDKRELHVDMVKFEGILSIFSNFRTDDIEFGLKKENVGLDRPERIVSLDVGGVIYELFKGKTMENYEYVILKIDGVERPFIYKISSSRIEGLRKNPVDLVIERKDSDVIEKR